MTVGRDDFLIARESFAAADRQFAAADRQFAAADRRFARADGGCAGADGVFARADGGFARADGVFNVRVEVLHLCTGILCVRPYLTQLVAGCLAAEYMGFKIVSSNKGFVVVRDNTITFAIATGKSGALNYGAN